MDERKPLIKPICGDKHFKTRQHGEWDGRQFTWIFLSLVFCNSAAELSSVFLTQYLFSRVAEKHSVNTSQINTAKSPCNSSQDNSTTLDDIQAEAAQWALFASLSVSIPSVVVNIVFGTHSDSWGRKPYFIIPTLGSLCRALSIVATVLWNLPLGIIVIGSFIEGLSGSYFMFLVASYSSVADMTNKTQVRTFAIALVDGLPGVASASVLLGSGYFIHNTGFFYPAVTISVIYVLGLSIQCCLLKESLTKTTATISLKERLHSMVSLYTADKNRVVYIICLATFFLLGASNIGKGGVTTLFAMNKPFCFSTVSIGWLQFTRKIVPSILGVLLLKCFHYCLSDETITVIGIVSSGGSMLLQGLSHYSYQLFLAPVAGVMEPTVYSLLRGIASRMTDPKHQGALFGGFGSVEVMSVIFSGLIMNLIYEKTVDIFAGTVFLVLSGISAVMLLLFMIVIIRKARATKDSGEITEKHINS